MQIIHRIEQEEATEINSLQIGCFKIVWWEGEPTVSLYIDLGIGSDLHLALNAKALEELQFLACHPKFRVARRTAANAKSPAVKRISLF